MSTGQQPFLITKVHSRIKNKHFLQNRVLILKFVLVPNRILNLRPKCRIHKENGGAPIPQSLHQSKARKENKSM